jgi:hypothetical protein
LIACHGLAGAQEDRSDGRIVKRTDPIYSHLVRYKEKILRDYVVGKAKFSPWIYLDSPAVRKLFPGLRFASITWEEEPPQFPAADCACGFLLLPITLTVAVYDQSGFGIVAVSGDPKVFGSLLLDRGAWLETESDARLIWDAYCAINHHESWAEQPSVRGGDNEWKLGVDTYDSAAFEHGIRTISTTQLYIRARTDPTTLLVNSWAIAAEVVNKRMVVDGQKGDTCDQ